MAEGEDQILGLVDELQLFAKTNSPHARSLLKLPLLAALCERSEDVASVGQCIDAAVAEWAQRPEASVLATIFQPSDELWHTNLSRRQREAAEQVGMSYDSFRRRRKGHPSPYDAVCTTLIEQLLGLESMAGAADVLGPELKPTYASSGAATVAPEMAAAPEGTTAPETTAGADQLGAHTQTRMWWAVAVTALAALGIVGGFFVWSSRSQPATVSPVAALGGLAAAPDCGVASPGSDTDSGSGIDEFESVRAAIREELVLRGSQACIRRDFEEENGIYFYHFGEGISVAGGAIVRPDGDDGFDTVILPAGPFWAFHTLGGFPTGEIVPSQGGYSMGTEVGHFQGETRHGNFYWLPTLGYQRWIEVGGGSGPFGAPTSDLYYSEGLLRMDFEHGFLTQQGDNTIGATIYSEPADPLPANEALAGTIIEARGGERWFIDGERRRWWIPNSLIHDCAGGDLNVSVDRPRGDVLHQLEFAGIASCPLGATGVSPLMGAPHVDAYCRVQSADSYAEPDGSGWRCLGGQVDQPVDLDAVCLWQYGSSAVLVREPTEGPICYRSQSVQPLG